MRRLGFTLIEMITVIGIIAVVAGLSFPAFSAAKKAANERRSVSDMRQIAMATIIYREDWKRTDYGDMASMGIPQWYSTAFHADRHNLSGAFPIPPIHPKDYPMYYWMPVSAQLDGRVPTWEQAVNQLQDRTVLVCDPWLPGIEGNRPVSWTYAEPNLINGIDLGGQLVKKKPYGEWFLFASWGYKFK